MPDDRPVASLFSEWRNREHGVLIAVESLVSGVEDAVFVLASDPTPDELARLRARLERYLAAVRAGVREGGLDA